MEVFAACRGNRRGWQFSWTAPRFDVRAQPGRVSQVVEHLRRGFPAHAGVRHALAIAQATATLLYVLSALDQMAFEHDAADAAGPGCDLRRQIPGDDRLSSMVAAAVAMAAIDHQSRRQARVLEVGNGTLDVGSVEVGLVAAAAQHEVTMRISGRRDHDGAAIE